MKRVTASFALLLTSSLVAGCGNTCDPAETIVYWTFTTASNVQTTSCSAAGVSTLRIWVNGAAQFDAYGNQDLRCSDYDQAGGAIVPSVSATERIQVEAYDAQQALLYASDDNVSVKSCGPTSVNVNLAAQQGAIVLRLTGFSQCPLNSYVWYSLTDLADPTNPWIVDGLSTNPRAVPCSGAVSFPGMPFGNYRLDFVQIVQGTSDPLRPYGAVYQSCTPQPFSHQADDAVNVTLTPATSLCTVQ